jgi:ParB-like chromosome segregation protein Spo0J
MKQSLASHGQLTPVVAVTRSSGAELVDGFKRHAAATQLGLPTLVVSLMPLDEMAQWTAMLLLNRGPQSMMALEEALVLRELVSSGLTQAQISLLLERHKTWVSRRLGLVERLHPDLVEQMRLGLLPAGVARRLLSLPRGNQLELSASALAARLGPRDTELLVSLWHRAKDPTARRALLSDPRAHLTEERLAAPRIREDPKLSPAGQRLQRVLRMMTDTASRASSLSRTPPPAADLARLTPDLRRASRAVRELPSVLGSFASGAREGGSDASVETC